MKILNDFRKLLPINALEIHILLPTELYRQYREKLEGLNNMRGFKTGPFRIKVQTLHRSGKSERLLPDLMSANILTRLLDESNDYYCYGYGTIDFNQNWSESKREIESFLSEAYGRNIANAECMKRIYEKDHLSYDYRIKALEGIIDYLGENPVKRKKERTADPLFEKDEVQLSDLPGLTYAQRIPDSSLGKVTAGLHERVKKVRHRDVGAEDKINRVKEELGIEFSQQDRNEIKKNKISFIGDLLGAMQDGSARKRIYNVLYGDTDRLRFDEEGFPVAGDHDGAETDPSIITIGLGTDTERRIRVRQYIRIKINDETKEVYPGIRQGVYYYALCLICRKKGIPFCREIIMGIRLNTEPSKWRPEVKWLRELHRLLFYSGTAPKGKEYNIDGSIDRDFRGLMESFICNIRNSKSKCNRAIRRVLNDEAEWVKEYCLISQGLTARSSVDWISIPSERIELGPDYDALLETMPRIFIEHVPAGFKF